MSGQLAPEGRYLLDFDTRDLPSRETDVLVIGGGVAGLSAALVAAESGSVLVIEKDEPEICNTAWAQGGVAAALGGGDNPAAHAADTIRTGCGLCDEEVVERVVGGASEAIDRLVAMGARFDREDGGFDLTQEGGHGRRRVLHRGDTTGLEIIRALLRSVARIPRIQMVSRLFVTDLLTEGGRCVGALVLDRQGAVTSVFAKSVVVASGGAGRLYRETSNVRGATGDGIAAAFRAGAALKDLEFVQFHPTTLYLAGVDRILVTEAVRGEGAHIVDNEGRRFLAEAHPSAELAPRDVVSRAIVAHLGRPGVTGVFLDMRHWPTGRARARFPGLVESCVRYGIDPERDLVPVRPAAHYFIGGIASGLDGVTTLPGLFACGEAACSGMHGANRLASNSLLEGLVLGARAGRAASAHAAQATAPLAHVRHAAGRTIEEREIDIEDLRKSLLSCTWRLAGIMRDGAGLEEASAAIRPWRFFSGKVRHRRWGGLELENLLLLGSMVTASAALRLESRGTHARREHPSADDARFLGSYVWTRERGAEFRPRTARSHG
ncbi:MAG TPA: L-aspartate oxidase [Candidatus Eisenbacteria bacterium]|nr:L-aspartate oxidase [Candidatus Eisenbacteria bacterium]